MIIIVINFIIIIIIIFIIIIITIVIINIIEVWITLAYSVSTRLINYMNCIMDEKIILLNFSARFLSCCNSACGINVKIYISHQGRIHTHRANKKITIIIMPKLLWTTIILNRVPPCVSVLLLGSSGWREIVLPLEWKGDRAGWISSAPNPVCSIE